MLCRGSSAAFLLPRPEKGVLWLISRWTHPARAAVVALVLTGLVDICSECRTGGPREGTCHPSAVGWLVEVVRWLVVCDFSMLVLSKVALWDVFRNFTALFFIFTRGWTAVFWNTWKYEIQQNQRFGQHWTKQKRIHSLDYWPGNIILISLWRGARWQLCKLRSLYHATTFLALSKSREILTKFNIDLSQNSSYCFRLI